MGLIVASTLAAFKCEYDQDVAWLMNAKEMVDSYPDVHFFAALQTGHGHDERFEEVRWTLDQLPSTVWTFSIDEGAESIDSRNRLVGICTGRNLAHEFTQRDQTCEAILFLDSDVRPPPDIIPRLMEIDRPVVGATVPTYCLSGEKVWWDGKNVRIGEIGWAVKDGPCSARILLVSEAASGAYMASQRVGGFGYEVPPFPEGANIEEHWDTAGALLIRRDVFRKIRWRWDLDAGDTDDPAFQKDTIDLGFGQTWVRHDVQCTHYPEAIGPLEQRGHDLSISR